MKIVGLMAENVKKLKLVNIRFEDGKPVITISGANEQGKSTFLDCFEYALSGAKSLKDVSMPIRKGEDHAKVVVETDEIIVTRTWTASGNTYLKVTNKDGWEPTGGAQALLDRLYSAFSFDPLSFSMMKDKDQLTTLLKMVKIPLDLDKWAIERKKVFDERTESNRQKSDLESQINGMVDSVLYVPDEETPVSAVLEEQAAAQAILNENNEKRRRHQEENSAAIATVRSGNEKVRGALEKAEQTQVSAKEKLDRWTNAVADLKKQLIEGEKALSDAKKEYDSNTKMLEDAKNLVSKLTDPDTMTLPEMVSLVDPDMTVFAEKLENVEATNMRVRSKKAKAKLTEALLAKTSESAEKTKKLATMDSEKATALKAAKFPIAGMSFDDNGIIYKDIPFSQCSSAERLRVSTAMGMAMNPKLKAMFIRDASLLDSKNKAMIEKMAEENGFMVFMEVADDTGKLGIFIEDGEVKAVNGEPFTLVAEEAKDA